MLASSRKLAEHSVVMIIFFLIFADPIMFFFFFFVRNPGLLDLRLPFWKQSDTRVTIDLWWLLSTRQ